MGILGHSPGCLKETVVIKKPEVNAQEGAVGF